MTKLDAIDKWILNLLQNDGKTTIKEIAGQLNMSNTPIFERIKRMERDGIIEGYTALVNQKKLGFNLVAFCSVTLERHQKDFLIEFEADIIQFSEVMECYHLAGTIDYLLKIHVYDMDHYQKFITQKLASINNIGTVQSSFVMTEVKNEHQLPI